MAGLPIKRFAVFALFGFWGGLAGSLSSGWLLDRIAATRVAPVYYLGLAASLLLLGLVPFEATRFVVILLALNFFQSGGQAILNTLLSQVYPTHAWVASEAWCCRRWADSRCTHSGRSGRRCRWWPRSRRV
jgi:AAHS family 4-hydroxybenzoate transporter-like MFS transporter